MLTVTNTVLCYGLGGSGPGFMEIDQYQYCARNWSTPRGAAVEIDTNAPYFTLGTKDNSSAEFGTGPFPANHTYVVGTSLTNFPRRMVTHYDGQLADDPAHRVPRELQDVTTAATDKYFVLHDDPDERRRRSDVKAVKIALRVQRGRAAPTSRS